MHGVSTDRQTETDRQTDRQTDSQTERQTLFFICKLGNFKCSLSIYSKLRYRTDNFSEERSFAAPIPKQTD